MDKDSSVSIKRQLRSGYFCSYAAILCIVVLCVLAVLGIKYSSLYFIAAFFCALLTTYFARRYSILISRALRAYRAEYLPKYFFTVFGSQPRSGKLDPSLLRTRLPQTQWNRADSLGELAECEYQNHHFTLIGALQLSHLEVGKKRRRPVRTSDFLGCVVLTDIPVNTALLAKLKKRVRKEDSFQFFGGDKLLTIYRAADSSFLLPSPLGASPDFNELTERSVAILSEYRELLDLAISLSEK